MSQTFTVNIMFACHSGCRGFIASSVRIKYIDLDFQVELAYVGYQEHDMGSTRTFILPSPDPSIKIFG